jgi:ferrous iron transport protein B
MPDDKHEAVLTVALIGNPNTGKSTLFGALVGIHQHVGNYPGATVEKTTGQMKHSGCRFELIDLPGLYSLAPRSPDEMVSVDLLLGRRADSKPVDAVICVVDASNLQRNLYLVSQVLELGLPTVVALNMVDVAESHDIAIDIERFRQRLGIPVVSIQANRRRGMSRLKAALVESIDRGGQRFESPFPKAFEDEVARLQPLLSRSSEGKAEQFPRYLVERLLLDASGYLENALLGENYGAAKQLAQARLQLA